MKHLPFSQGKTIPILGLGTWESVGERCTEAVKTALDVGYTHIDTAEYYGNFRHIGRGIDGVKRKDLFLASKFIISSDAERDIRATLMKTLEELTTSYLDLYLIHWPNSSYSLADIVLMLKAFQHEGLVKSVGVSNFTIHHLQDLMDKGVHVDVNQVECHPLFFPRELHAFCVENDILFEAYSPLARGKIANHQKLMKIGRKYGKSACQVALRWLIQKGIVALPKATSRDHLVENITVFDFSLDKQEMGAIDRMHCNYRIINPPIAEFDY